MKCWHRPINKKKYWWSGRNFETKIGNGNGQGWSWIGIIPYLSVRGNGKIATQIH